MGQYFYAVILDEQGNIVVWMSPQSYDNGLKLTEHSFLGNTFVSTFEFGLSPLGVYHKHRVVWAGDYAPREPEKKTNLHQECNEYNCIQPKVKDTTNYRFVLNHSKKKYVDKSNIPAKNGCTLHPLPLLTAEGNGLSGGDYHRYSPLIGSWARDVISVEEEKPTDFEEILFDLVEET